MPFFICIFCTILETLLYHSTKTLLVHGETIPLWLETWWHPGSGTGSSLSSPLRELSCSWAVCTSAPPSVPNQTMIYRPTKTLVHIVLFYSNITNDLGFFFSAKCLCNILCMLYGSGTKSQSHNMSHDDLGWSYVSQYQYFQEQQLYLGNLHEICHWENNHD